MGTRGAPPGARTAISDCADRPPHNARSTPRPLTAAVVLTVELSLLRCAAPAPSSLTTLTLSEPPSWPRHCLVGNQREEHDGQPDFWHHNHGLDNQRNKRYIQKKKKKKKKFLGFKPLL